MVSSEGHVVIRVEGQEVEAASAQGAQLPAGAVISCREGARAVLEFAPGLAVVVLPNTKFSVGADIAEGARGLRGSGVPSHAASCDEGLFVIIASEQGLASAALEISTPKGTISPVLPGRAAVSVGPASEGSPVTVISPTAVLVVAAQRGLQTPLPRGLGMLLGGTSKRPMPLADIARGASLKEAADSVAASPQLSALFPWGVP